MIRIEPDQLNHILKTHLDACAGYITPRLNFYLDLFNALGFKNLLGEDLNLLQRYTDLNPSSLRSLINPLLKSKYQWSSKTHSIKIEQIRSILISEDYECINQKYTRKKLRDYHKILSQIKTDLRQILIGEPDILDNLYKLPIYAITNEPGFKECLKKIFSYKTFSQKGFLLNNNSYWNNYSLTMKIGISVCPYCNRNWINTVITSGRDKSKVTNPQLDHFMPQEKYPVFGLSFFNLIPSCETCNSRLKKDKDFSIDKNLHPYISGYDNVRFKAMPTSIDEIYGFSTRYRINLELGDANHIYKDQIIANHSIFKIKEIYEEHGDIVAEIFQKRYFYSDTYLSLLSNQHPLLRGKKKEIYRLAFSNYYQAKDFNKRPFAKLTRDIVHQLGFSFDQ